MSKSWEILNLSAVKWVFVFNCNNALIQYMWDVMRVKVLRKKPGWEPLKLYKFHLWLDWYRFSNTYTSIHVNCLSFIIPKFTPSSLIKITMHSWIWVNINRDNNRMAGECEALARRLSESAQLESERDDIQALENQSQKVGQEIQLLCGWVRSEGGRGTRKVL